MDRWTSLAVAIEFPSAGPKSHPVIGTFINVGGILLGGIAGLTVARHISARAQQRLRMLLVALTVYAGFSLIWQGLKSPLGHTAGQLGIALLALTLGSALGSVLRLQHALNRAGQWSPRASIDGGSVHHVPH